jgi:hypothetical protein
MNNLIFKNGYKGFDFIVFNPLEIELDNSEPLFNKIFLPDIDFWNDIKAKTWSSGCNFFFVIDEENIIIGDTKNNDGLKCNLSMNVFDEFFKATKKTI